MAFYVNFFALPKRFFFLSLSFFCIVTFKRETCKAFLFNISPVSAKSSFILGFEYAHLRACHVLSSMKKLLSHEEQSKWNTFRLGGKEKYE